MPAAIRHPFLSLRAPSTSFISNADPTSTWQPSISPAPLIILNTLFSALCGDLSKYVVQEAIRVLSAFAASSVYSGFISIIGASNAYSFPVPQAAANSSASESTSTSYPDMPSVNSNLSGNVPVYLLSAFFGSDSSLAHSPFNACAAFAASICDCVSNTL